MRGLYVAIALRSPKALNLYKGPKTSSSSLVPNDTNLNYYTQKTKKKTAKKSSNCVTRHLIIVMEKTEQEIKYAS